MFEAEQIEKLKRLIQDPDWNIVETMFLEYLEPLKSIDNIDIADTNRSVKGEIKARKHFVELIQRFFSDCHTIASGRVVEQQDPRDSME